MLRRAVIAALTGLVLAGPAAAEPQELLPGLTYERRIEFTTRGPVVANVLTVPRPGGLWQLKPVLSSETILGTERLTAMEARYAAKGTVAGINGDLFLPDGHPTGMLMRNGALDQPPLAGRSSIGLDASGALQIARVTMLATWQGSGPRRALTDVNGPAGPNGVSLFTTAWGTATPSAPGAVELTLSQLPAATPNVELTSPVAAVSANGGTGIPPGGAVLSARGAAAQRLQNEATLGSTIKIRLILKPAWAGVIDALGGGPVLVRNGKPIFRANEQFTADQLLPRKARSAIGQLADGRFLLVTADGADAAYSTGVTNFELALLMAKLGAVSASALGSGNSAAMAFDGRLVSRPSAPELPVGDAVLALYAGVYVPPALEAVLSPNGDGLAEQQRLSYKVVRASTVTTTLIGPDGDPRAASTTTVGPGTYSFDWPGTKQDGAPELEGRWRWVVTATDDAGQASSAERSFDLNRTLGFPATVPAPLGVPRSAPRSVATFKLTRPATVVARIATASGVVLRTLPSAHAETGDVDVAWDGATDGGAVVYSGRYVAEVTATNELGSVTLGAPFTVRRNGPRQ